MPLVSVIVPVYNVEKYILRCINSIQQQSLNDIEIIVVNDCTPDNSMAIVQELAKDDQRIKILSHEKNMGLMWTRRTGYREAEGDYIIFCDSDDYLPLNAVEKLYFAAMESNADIVCGNHLYITTKGEKRGNNNELKYGNSTVSVLKSLLRHELVHNLCGKMFKASLLQQNEYKTFEKATNGEDACLFYQVIGNTNRMILINDIVYYYMQNSESSSQMRRSYNALESLCIANAEIVAVSSEFPELKKELDSFVSENLVSLIYRGYNKDGMLSKLFLEHGLEYYCSNMTIIKSHSIKEATKLLLKKYLFRKQVS